jgi:hypothetical protein
MSGDSDMSRMIAKLRALQAMPANAAPKVAVAVRESLQSTIDASTTAYGEPWELTVDGRKALKTAGKSLRVTSIGHRVFAALSGHVARHNNGTAKGGTKRRVLPNRAIPLRMSARIAVALSDVFRSIADGGD